MSFIADNGRWRSGHKYGGVHNGLAVDDCDGCDASQTDIARGTDTSNSEGDKIIGQPESVRHLQFTQNSFVVGSNDDALMNTDGLEHGCPFKCRPELLPRTLFA